jgi:hypothetical protein
MDTSTQFQTQSIGALPAITHYLAQYQGSCHRVPFGLDCWDFPENSAWRPAASRAKPLILQGLAPRTFPKRAELGKVLGSPLRRSPRQKCQSARGLHPDGTSSQLLWGWAKEGNRPSFPEILRSVPQTAFPHRRFSHGCCRYPKVRGFLQAEEALTFLDRLHRQLQEAVPEDQLRAELVWLWWLRRQRPRANATGGVAGAGHVAHLVQQVVCQKVDANWQELYVAVSRVLRRTVRASSAVECMNSVLRMHQSRHRTVTQGLLDLKRLYWNCRAFREGKRRRQSPYELLGLKLPSYRFWDLLWMPTMAEGTT